ncbi:hypothetical protein [Flavivirga eckloniae]|uniref:Uncharacterized protein n=1 Tax=Flavivirga eckloniae TaxID=1803846 RepID=A0A2K9PVR9_9FLAO|nr:hypothetical protein [Flavivirga eckloniae]AUP80607.1 hypothetical protein C1H87_18575 [Flavivirga eckloniae]
MKTKHFVILAVLAVIVVVFGANFFWCSGECETRKCTVNNPCVINGKKYVRGEICVSEGVLCDDGIFRDCHCNTRIIGAGPANYRPTCDCN